jgi:arylsulfatase A-like enzyme
MSIIPTRGSAAPLGIALVALSLIGPVAPARADERPNVLFLFTDDQRPDTIRALGNEHIRTPHIDRLAAEGVSFDNAHIMGATSMAVCTPSRACLFSGRTLWNLASQGPWDFAIPERHRTLAQVFREDGYTTFATGKNDPGFGRDDHFMRSFDRGENIYYRGGHRGQDRTPLFSVSIDDGILEKTPVSNDGRFNADLFADACVDFLESRKDVEQPFFAYVSFMTPHDPLNAPAEYLDMYAPRDIELPENFMPQHPFDSGVGHIRDEKLMNRPLDERAMRERLAKYYGLITHTDAQIGRILDALERSGHAGNTLIVFASDNGLALGSHGLTGKQNLYQHSVRVPLILAGPGIPKGQRRDQLCYLYDMYPTLCERAGIEVPDTVQYRSLGPVIDDAGAEHRGHLYFAFMQWHRALRDERHKLIEYGVDGRRHTQLFDLRDDPAETRNLAGEEAMKPTLARLRARLIRESRRLGERKIKTPHLREMVETFWNAYDPEIPE